MFRANVFSDTQFLHRAIEDAGRWAFGVVLVELWVLEDTGTRLFRPDRGWWIDQYADKDARFSCLTDESLPDYIPADPVMPGIGLPGYLWSQATGQCDGSPRQSIAERLSILGGRRSTFSRKSFYVEHAANPRASGIFNRISMLSDWGSSQFGPSDEKLTWCEVKPLANDPLQPYDERFSSITGTKGDNILPFGDCVQSMIFCLPSRRRGRRRKQEPKLTTFLRRG